MVLFQKEIKDAYFRLSKLWHPDLHQNSDESSAKFVEIGEAYEILSDPVKRKSYDDKIGIHSTGKHRGQSSDRSQWDRQTEGHH